MNCYLIGINKGELPVMLYSQFVVLLLSTQVYFNRHNLLSLFTLSLKFNFR